MTERSGTRRIVLVVAMPGAFCHKGRDQSCDAPPPPEPHDGAVQLSFHTLWTSGLKLETVRPPTPVTRGWEAGSSTAGLLLVMPVQSEEPKSPAAETTVWPCAAICSKITCSAVGPPLGSISQSPQDVVMIVAVLSSTSRWPTTTPRR